jgi:tocopherol cyclase
VTQTPSSIRRLIERHIRLLSFAFATAMAVFVAVVVVASPSVAVASLQTMATTSSPSAMPAHVFEWQGPWFEGWYTRVIDADHGVSIATITTSAIGEGQTLGRSKSPPGYAAIVIADGSFTKSFEAFPQATRIGNTVVEKTGLDYFWNAEGLGSSSSVQTDLKIDDAHVKLNIESRVSWSPIDHIAGPEGSLQGLPLPLHWFVHNTRGRASYSVDYLQNGRHRHISGVGLVHQEKNWGQVFPKSWVWMQGANDRASISLAGGDVEIGPITAHSYFVGYRSEKVFADFNLGQGLLTTFKDKVDWCTRTVKMIAYSGQYKLEMKASAEPESFVSLSIPTAAGYQPRGAFESFHTRIQTRVYKINGFVLAPDYTLLESESFDQGALEFGANASICRAAR